MLDSLIGMLQTAMAAALAVTHDPRLLTMVLVAGATMATIIGFGMPYLQGDGLTKRMKSVAVERTRIRAREREAAARGDTVALRQATQPLLKQIVDSLDLTRWLGTEDAKIRLTLAGYRNPGATNTFLVSRLILPLVCGVLAAVYVFLVAHLQWPLIGKLGVCLAGLYVGMKGPEIYLGNVIAKRQLSVKKSWPDALDLLLICVESGMSIEHAFRRVSTEVGSASVPLAEELALTTAELSYLPERRKAYENLAIRTGLDGVKAVCTALAQAEKYGTPLGSALRVLAQENRDMRMMEAEKKAAQLPPMLTVPMILFFLPVLFVVIMGPAMINVMGLK
jgi:tight adherence protein C